MAIQIHQIKYWSISTDENWCPYPPAEMGVHVHWAIHIRRWKWPFMVVISAGGNGHSIAPLSRLQLMNFSTLSRYWPPHELPKNLTFRPTSVDPWHTEDSHRRFFHKWWKPVRIIMCKASNESEWVSIFRKYKSLFVYYQIIIASIRSLSPFIKITS